LPFLGHWAICHYGFECRLNQFHIVAVGSIHTHPYGNTLPFSQQTAFGSLLASVCGIRASALTPQAEPWSWLHPLLATANLCHVPCRIEPTPVAITSRRLQWLAKAETDHVQCLVPRRPEARLSTGSLYASRRRSHPCTGGQVSRACHPSHAASPQAAAVQFSPTGHRESANHRPHPQDQPLTCPSSSKNGRKYMQSLKYTPRQFKVTG
jgi:hypothetical protein